MLIPRIPLLVLLSFPHPSSELWRCLFTMLMNRIDRIQFGSTDTLPHSPVTQFVFCILAPLRFNKQSLMISGFSVIWRSKSVETGFLYKLPPSSRYNVKSMLSSLRTGQRRSSALISRVQKNREGPGPSDCSTSFSFPFSK